MAGTNFEWTNFNDGEDVEYLDFVQLQTQLQALVTDSVVAAGVGTGAGAGTPVQPATWTNPANQVYATGLSGYPYASTTGVTNAPGALQQVTGNLNGLSSVFKHYVVDKDELASTFASNSSGNDRYDLVSVHIDEPAPFNSVFRDFKDAVTGAVTSIAIPKSRSNRITVSVVQGTPSATPTIPTVASGYVGWCAVRIPNGYTTGTAVLNSNIVDLRIPNRRAGRIFTSQDFLAQNPGSVWSQGTGSNIFFWQAAIGTDYIYVPLTGPSGARLMALSVGCSFPVAPNALLFQAFPGDATLNSHPFGPISVPSNGGVVTWSPVGNGPAVWWTNGSPAGPIGDLFGGFTHPGNSLLMLALQAQAGAASFLYTVKAEFAY